MSSSASDAPEVSAHLGAAARSAATLHRRFLSMAVAVGIAAILLVGGTASLWLWRTTARQGDAMLSEAAHRSALVLGSALDERARETAIVAMMPPVVAAAREGARRAAALGLTGDDILALERRFDADRSLLVASATRAALRAMLPRLDARDMLLTDSSGVNSLITDRSVDFVQSDERWWQDAWRGGTSISDAAFDPASRTTVVSLAAVIRDEARPVGVLKIKYDVSPLVSALATAGGDVRVDVLDSAGRILLSSDSGAMNRSLGNAPAPGVPGNLLTGDRAATRIVGSAGWRVVAHVSRATIDAPWRAGLRVIVATMFLLLAALFALLYAMHRFLTRRVTAPLGSLASAAEAVAAGNFAVDMEQSSSNDEIGRLSRAVAAMILELRRLAQAIGTSARETSMMTSEISAGSEEMAATAGEIASTASDLSEQATSMAENIGALAGSATSLRELADELRTGAQEGVERNLALRTLAAENRTGLDTSARSLANLADDVHASAHAIEALASASGEIRSFVTLVRKLARQSKLLALNAAMEAARAGAQGEGFAVVATEVRRLAAMSSDAAERTEAVVNGVLSGIESSRESAGRAVATAAQVRESTALASQSFADIEQAVHDAEAWTAAVHRTSVSTSDLVAQMTDRLDALTSGTDNFAAAMEQVAASSQEQSAATQEIAGAANTLGAAADRLTRLVTDIKVGERVAPSGIAHAAIADVEHEVVGAGAMLAPALAN